MENLRYRIGLDLGIASVGWAVIANDTDGNPERIVARGVRTFEACENPKDGKALAAERREARSMRRRLRRKQHRLFRIKKLISEEYKLDLEKVLDLFEVNSTQRRDVYTVRYKALDEKVSDEEFIRLLVHLAQKRGFKSNRKNEDGGDVGKLKKAVQSNEIEIAELSCRTVGEFLYKKYITNGNFTVRNKAESYKNTFSRAQIDDEVNTLFECQRKYGNAKATLEFKKKYKDILFSQRAFDEGPGEPSKYGGGIEKMLGVCTFENVKNGMKKNETRAPRNSYSCERFTVLQKINNLRLVENGKAITLNDEQHKTLETFIFEKGKITHADIRKVLGFDENIKFAFFIKDESKVFSEVKGYHALKKCLDTIQKGFIKTLPADMLNKIAYCLTIYKNDESIKRELESQGFDEKIINALTSKNAPSFSKVSNLSIKAIDKIIPYLEKGFTYDKACEAAGYDFRNRRKDGERHDRLNFNDISDEIIAPVVKRATSQAIKVINAIVREFGLPEMVCIELAREMAKNFDERNKARRENEKNQERNEGIVKKIKELGLLSPGGEDIVKYKLWQDQQGFCAYSGERIPVEKLFEPKYTEVDHIIPWSKSFDNSYKNKVLVLTRCNQEKGNRLPIEYIASKGKKELDRYILWVKTFIFSNVKKTNLLCSEVDQEGFQQRNLQDTRYATSKLADFLRKYLQFTDNEKIKEKVLCVNGGVTSYLRKLWGMEKSRETDDHHAKDAIYTACCSQKLINQISKYEKIRKSYLYDAKAKRWTPISDNETYEDASVANNFPLPWSSFREDMNNWFSNEPQEKTIKPLFVSKMSNHKITGEAHKATFKRLLTDGKQEFFVKKVQLTDLKLTKDGEEIQDYYNKESDKLLYEKLLKRLQAFDGDATKAFPKDTEFRKPSKNGEGNIVKTVKIQEKTSGNVKLSKVGGAAANGTMVRIDVFAKEHKDSKQFYFAPIYVSDFNKKELPNTAVPSGKTLNESEGYIFEFSLFAKDLVRIKRKSDEKPLMLYYMKSDRSTGSISLSEHNNSDSKKYITNIGIKTLEIFEKWEVDVLGNYRQATKIPRVTKTLYKNRSREVV